MAASATVAFLAPQTGPFATGTARHAAPPVSAMAVAEAGVSPSPSPCSASRLCTGLTLGIASATVGTLKKRGRAARSAAFDPTGAVGVLSPLGYWDPCGLMKERVGADGCEWKDEETFKHYRTAELKHGRVAMMAAVGMLTTTVWKFPGFQEVPDGLAALQNGIGGSGFGIVFIMASYFEITNPAGDFDFPGPWEINDEMKTKEIANGRLAMCAVVTLFLYEYGAGVLPSEQIAAMLSTNVQSGLGFAAAWAALVASFAWTQPQGAAEIAWSYDNFLNSKGMGPKSAAWYYDHFLHSKGMGPKSAKLPVAELEPVKAVTELEPGLDPEQAIA